MLTCPLSRLPRIKSRKKYYGGILKNHLSSIFYWMPEYIFRGSVADVGFDVVCYNIEKGNRFYLSDR